MKAPQFSLGTLMLVVVWCGMGMMVWVLREPWYRSSSKQVPPGGSYIQKVASPDGNRALLMTGRWMWGGGPVVIADAAALNVAEATATLDDPRYELFEFEESIQVCDLRFFDNDTVSFTAFSPSSDPVCFLVTYKRRFPEWWWGHFYRPEVWVFGVLSGLLMLRGIRAWRARWINARGSVRDRRPGSSSSLAGTPA